MKENLSALEIKDLHIGFKTQDGVDCKKESVIEIVKGIDLTAPKGICTAIVGESGSGKTLLARSVIALLPLGATVTEGDIQLSGSAITTLAESDLCRIRGKKVAMIFQDPLAALDPLQTIEKQVAEAVSAHHEKAALSRSELRDRVIELLTLVELNRVEERLTAYPHELSGGERQRVVIAIALANTPDVLLADEPTTALDAALRQTVLNLLLRLCREKNIALLLISHDLGLVRKAADVICVMQKGRMVETIDLRENRAFAPVHPYSKLLLSVDKPRWIEDDIKNENPQRFIAFCQNRLPVAIRTQKLRVDYAQKSRKLFGRATAFTALHELDLTVFEGETLAVIGESGSGKSTLACALLRLIPSQGSIELYGRELQGLSFKELTFMRSIVQPVFQDPFASLDPRMTVADIVTEGLKVSKKLSPRELEKAAVDALQDAGLTADYRFRFPHELSGGQRQRVGIARALAMNPKILILDEPTSSLDRALQFQFTQLIERLQKQRGLTCIFITHDLALVRGISHRVLVLKKGRVVEYGRTKEVFLHPKSQYLKNLLDNVFGQDPQR